MRSGIVPMILFACCGFFVGSVFIAQWDSRITSKIAEAPPVISDEVLFPCDLISVHDGDTIKVRIQLPWEISLTEDVRCLGYDAWEVTKGRRSVKATDDEVRRGKIARDELKALLTDARLFLSPENDAGTRDNYGRVLGFIRVQKGDELIRLEQWMYDHNHCRSENE